MAPPILILRDIHLTFGGTPLLESAELSVSSDDKLCLVGRNGSGKSTLLKIAADMIVPFERSEEMNRVYRRGFETRGLDYAIWGHISDGNVHPNVIPRSYDEVERGMEAILEFGREVARLGGCPLAEHGVGRSPIKQALLHQLYGDDGIEQMRAVKRVLDPEW